MLIINVKIYFSDITVTNMGHNVCVTTLTQFVKAREAENIYIRNRSILVMNGNLKMQYSTAVVTSIG